MILSTAKIKTLVRLIFFAIAVSLLIYTNIAPNEKSQSVAEFKLKMLQKIQMDSLNSDQKVKLVMDETSEFVETSSRVKDGLRYLTWLFAMAIIAELIFLVLKKNGEYRQS
jgi:hypothetical protein